MMNEILTFICSKLDETGIEYMLSGSMAMGIYTVSRSSMDIDLVINLKDEDVDRFLKIFEARYFIQPETVRAEVKRKGMFNVIDTHSRYKIDFIVKKDSEYRNLEFSRRKQFDFINYRIWIVSIEDLILSKLIWIQELKSEIQMRDIAMLLLNHSIDKKYLQQWIGKLSLNTYGLL